MKPLIALTAMVVALVLVLGEEQHETCMLWKDLAKHMSSDNRSEMTCVSNNSQLCTSVDCQGTYNYKSWMLPDRDLEMDYCVGIWLHHCDIPVTMEIYMEIPRFKVNYTHRVAHNEMLPIPGMYFDMGIGQTQGFFHFQMLRNGDNLTFGLEAKVKLTIANRSVMWPEELKKTVIPPETIPVPPCRNRTGIPHPTRPPCTPGFRRPIPSVPLLSSTTPTQNIIHPPTEPSKTYHRNCSDSEEEACGELEVCNLETRQCECDPDFVFDDNFKTCLTRNKLGQGCDPHSVEFCGPNEECAPSSKSCQCQPGFAFNHQRQICTYIVKDAFVPQPPSHQHVIPGGAGYIIPGARKSEEAGSSPSAEVIVAAVISSVILVAAALALFFFMRNRRRRDGNDRSILLINDEAEIM